MFHHLKTTTHYGWKGAAILLDVEKAFDSVWHNGLKYKVLEANLGLPERYTRILALFLNNRSIKVRVKKHQVLLKAGTP